MTMTKEQLKFLKAGRNFLANHVTDKQFNMGTFMEANRRKGYRDVEVDEPLPTNCGTVGCALGWMARAPEFRKEIDKPESNILRYGDVHRNLLGLDLGRSREEASLWKFLFDAEYSFINPGTGKPYDNTREGAIGRIDVILKYPDLFDNEVADV